MYSFLLLITAFPRHIPARHADQNLSVFAAASLKDAFTTIARQFEASHLGTHVSLNFEGSQALSAQISQGAPADVFASASMKNLLSSNPDRSSLRTFAFNRLTIVVRKDWFGIRSVRDLSRAPKLVMADDSVPAGGYGEAFLGKAAQAYGKNWLAEVRSHIVSRELDVRSVLAKVRLGEADAGIVYITDAVSAGSQVRNVLIPEQLNVRVKYPVAVTSTSTNPDSAKAFVKFLFTPAAQNALTSQGFVSPVTAVNRIVLVSGGKERVIRLPLSSRLPQVTTDVAGPEGKTKRVTGVPLVAILGTIPNRVTFIGADDYSKTFNAPDLANQRAILVREADGNYQVVVVGFKPNWWVKWIRKIEVE